MPIHVGHVLEESWPGREEPKPLIRGQFCLESAPQLEAMEKYTVCVHVKLLYRRFWKQHLKCGRIDTPFLCFVDSAVFFQLF